MCALAVSEVIYAADILSAVTQAECGRLAELAAGGIVLEMGAHLGRSTVALASTALRVHSIDWHRGDGHAGYNNTLQEFIRNLDRYGLRDKVVAHVGRFEDVIPVFRARQFDLIFLDGFHEEAQVLVDFDQAKGALRAGGAFAFHDYGSPTFGVTAAVDRLGLPIERTDNLAVIWP